MTPRPAILAGAILCLLAAPGRARAGDADAYLGADRDALFRSYVADIRDGIALSTNTFQRLGTTWDAELGRSRKRFLAARTKEDVYYALLSLKNTVHDAHSRLSVPDSLLPRRETLRLPLGLRPARDSAGLKFVVAWSRRPGVEKGFTLKRYQGRTPEEALAEFTEWYPSGSPEHREFEFARWLTARDSNNAPLPETRAADLVFRDERGGRDVAVNAEFTEPRGAREGQAPASEPALRDDPDYDGRTPDFSGLNYRVYRDSATRTLVLRYFSFGYDFEPSELWNRMRRLSYEPPPVREAGRYEAREAFEKIDVARLAEYLKSRNAAYDRLLVDVRENGGGPIAQRLTELLARKPFRGTWSYAVFTPLLRRDKDFRAAAYRHPEAEKEAMSLRELESGAERSSPHAFVCVTPACGPRDGDGRPAETGLNYKTFLLIGPYCVSSCDQFAAVFVDNDLGESVGLPAQGASSPSRADKTFKLADGEEFSITLSFGITFRPNGEILEGNPARPHMTMYPGPNYLRKVLDAIASRTPPAAGSANRDR
ncbi:MAG: S41 family peptidase [Elusimicrobiota bacterium]